jgi:hypothetical protein
MLRAASLAVLAVLAALMAACGGGAASGGADPASAVPAGAPFYFEVVIRPEGDLREDALAAAGKVLRTDDPSAKIREYVDKALRESSDTKLDYEKDIEPWLGERAGVWLSDATDKNGEPVGSAIIAITDKDLAQQSVEESRKKDGGATMRSYKDVSYEVDEDGVATGLTEDFVIAGPEAQFKQTVDALEGDEPLAESDRYTDGRDKLADDRLGHFYVDFQRLLKLGFESEPNGAEQLRQFQQIVPLEKIGPVMGSFAANGDRLALDVSVDFAGAKSLGPLGNLTTGASTPLLKELPGDTWGAFGTPDYGKSLAASLDSFAGAFGGAALEGQLRQQYGIDLNEDVLSWIGDVAFFIRGNSITDLDGGAVIEVTDDAKAATGFGKLVGLLQSAGDLDAKPIKIDGADAAFAVQDGTTPKEIVFARGNGKVVIAYGSDAATAALTPADKLGDAELFAQAEDALEDIEPGFLLSMPAVIDVARSVSTTDAEYEKVKPYLEAYDVVAFGAEGGSGRAKLRVAAGLK